MELRPLRTGRIYKTKLTYTFSKTMPLAWDAPPKGLAFHLVPMWAFLNSLSAHRCSLRWFTCLRAVRIPRGLPGIVICRSSLKSRLGSPKSIHYTIIKISKSRNITKYLWTSTVTVGWKRIYINTTRKTCLRHGRLLGVNLNKYFIWGFLKKNFLVLALSQLMVEMNTK